MSKPPRKKVEVFTETLYGVFGRFKTTESYEVNYLLSNLDINNLDRLTIASAAFNFANIRFEDMMQRDVDYERVDEKIIQQYLEKGRGRVLFFPPIIVSVVAVESEQVKDLYDSVEYQLPDGVETLEDVQDDSELSIIFDKDKFCIQLALAEADTGFALEVEGVKFNYHSAWATFKYNKRKIQLIVIDGQHRFEALSRLVKRNASLVEAVELPVCIVFTPEAKTSNTSHERIVKDLREMFVTINTTAKEVSGHFIDLLKDKSLASIAVRSLANKWKATDQDPWRCMLQQLEWNERQDNKANTIQRDYSISTVSIIAEALRIHAFGTSSDGLQYSLLGLSAVEAELESGDEAIKAYAIEESKFDPAQEEILQKQIEKLITPALDTLFTKPRPYQEIRSSFLKAVNWLDLRVNSGSDAAATFRKDILGQFRRCTKKDESNVRSFQVEFDEHITKQDDDDIYFLNVFQQALIGVWSDVSDCFYKELKIAPHVTAQILVETFEQLVFNPRARFFDRDMPYVSPVLYSGRRLNLTKGVKIAWKNLLKSTLLEKNTKLALEKAVKKYIQNIDEVAFVKMMEKVSESSSKSLDEYCKDLHEKIATSISKEWRQRTYDRGLKDKLEELFQENPDEYKKTLEALSNEEFNEAVEKLSNKLHIERTQLVWKEL